MSGGNITSNTTSGANSILGRPGTKAIPNPAITSRNGGGNVQSLCGDGDRCQQPQHQQQRLDDLRHMRLATMFTVSARTTRLKKNDRTPCIEATRRMTLLVIETSDTWEVMPMTREK